MLPRDNGKKGTEEKKGEGGGGAISCARKGIASKESSPVLSGANSHCRRLLNGGRERGDVPRERSRGTVVVGTHRTKRRRRRRLLIARRIGGYFKLR